MFVNIEQATGLTGKSRATISRLRQYAAFQYLLFIAMIAATLEMQLFPPNSECHNLNAA
jgi:hypothetical protein